jgi:hypothetical protein
MEAPHERLDVGSRHRLQVWHEGHVRRAVTEPDALRDVLRHDSREGVRVHRFAAAFEEAPVRLDGYRRGIERVFSGRAVRHTAEQAQYVDHRLAAFRPRFEVETVLGHVRLTSASACVSAQQRSIVARATP